MKPAMWYFIGAALGFISPFVGMVLMGPEGAIVGVFAFGVFYYLGAWRAGFFHREPQRFWFESPVKLGGTPALVEATSPLNPVGNDYDLVEAQDMREKN